MVQRIGESGVHAVADFVVSNDDVAVVYAFCAAHPQSYKAVITSTTREHLVVHGQDIYCLPEYDFPSATCQCRIRVDQLGIFLNGYTPAVPLWLAVWQPQLLHRLFGSSVEVSVVDLDTLSLETLLQTWETTGVRVRAITSKRRFTACVAQHRRLTGRLYTALTALEELQLLPSPYEDSSLAVVEYMPSLRDIFANACRVEYLKPLRGLYHLQELQIAQTQIRDRELDVLAALPQLTTLGISACPHLTSLNALARCPALRVLRAANCERLVRVAQLSKIATLRTLDLSENVFLPSEFGSLLAGQALALQTGYFLHLRWPREDPVDAQAVLGAVTHLYLSYCTLPNIRWLCGAQNLEQLYLNHTNVTARDMSELALHVPYLRVLSLSYCERLQTNLDFVHSLAQLTILTISRSSLPSPFPELETFRRSMTVNFS